ncbi:MAG: HEAT repeat domain-containing protein [Cyanobacteria bacterium P01_D01_bin.1]
MATAILYVLLITRFMPPVKPVSSTERTVLNSSPSEKSAGEKSVEEKSVEEKSVEDAIDQAIAHLEEDDFHTQWESAKQLSKQIAQWGDRSIPYLINHLQTATNPDIQWFLVRVLRRFDHIEVVEAIARLLTTTQNEDLQVEICKALTDIGRSAIETVSELLDRRHPIERRVLAARVLACIRRSATIEPLLSVAKDDSPTLRLIAIEALGSFHDARITPILLAALEESSAEADAATCIEAIRTLGRRSDLLPHTDLVGPLRWCLLSKNHQIAKESAIALGRLGTKNAAIALGEALMQPVATPVKVTIVRALGWIDSDEAIQSLAIAFRQGTPLIMPAVKPEIAKALGQTHNPSLKIQAAQPLIDWLQMHADEFATDVSADDLNQPSAELKRAIISALARLGEIAAIEVLIPLLASSNEQIKIHALSALDQINRESAKAQLQDYLADKNNSVETKNKVRESLRTW